MQYPLHNNLTKYIYVHVYYMTAKVNSFYSFDLYYKEMQKWFLFSLFFFNKTYRYIVYLCNNFKTEIDNWEGDQKWSFQQKQVTSR